MVNKPSRIDLLELDIDLRLTDLWREAGDISEWNLDVVAAFMRAAYGKGYCDALTEDAPGSLCHDHGYRIPGRRPAPDRSLPLMFAERRLTAAPARLTTDPVCERVCAEETVADVDVDRSERLRGQVARYVVVENLAVEMHWSITSFDGQDRRGS